MFYNGHVTDNIGDKIMKVYKIVFCNANDINEDVFRKLCDMNYIVHTDYNTIELSAYDVRLIEDDIKILENATDEEHIEQKIATPDDRFALQEGIGLDTYTMLLNEEIDMVMFVYE
jgi:hypothetical protein